MESPKIYEESYNELLNLKKSLSQDEITIDFTKFDSRTAGRIKDALARVAHEREQRVYSVISKNV